MSSTSGTGVSVVTDWHLTDKGCLSLTLAHGGHTVRVTQRKPGATFERVVLGRDPRTGKKKQRWLSLETKDQATAQASAERFLVALVAVLEPGCAARVSTPGTATAPQPSTSSAAVHRESVQSPPVLATRPETLQELWELWELFRDSPRFKANKPHTTRDEDSRSAILLAGFGPNTRLVDVDVDACVEYQMRRLNGKITYTVSPKSRTGRQLPPRQRTAPEVSVRSLEADMKLLRTMILWAMRKRLNGRRLLDEDPTEGYEIKEEKNPRREVADQRRFEASLAAAERLARRHEGTEKGYLFALLWVVLIVLEGTGRRTSAVLGLRVADLYLDVDGGFSAASAIFRADLDKKGVEADVELLESVARSLHEWIRDGRRDPTSEFVFPYLDPKSAVKRDRLAQAFVEVEEEAGLEPLRGTLFHAYRRKFASDRAHQPSNVVMRLMGLADAQTFHDCYCKTSSALQREVLNGSQKEWDRRKRRAA